MSGLLALLDDVAALTKAAAAAVDDMAGQAAKAGAKAAGVVIDDAAVTPQYVSGMHPSRELPVVWRIARASVRNKLLILLPVALLLSVFAPWAITPLLMLGGAYLGFEGAEKIAHLIRPNHTVHGTGEKREGAAERPAGNPAHLEEERVSGAIKTDFILSAEIMTIALSAIPETGLWQQGAVLAAVAVGITALVYGSVALIVKADDLGLFMARAGRLRPTRWLGRMILRFMPRFMAVLTAVGTVAMLWVSGSILLHGLEVLGLEAPAHLVKAAGEGLARMMPDGLAAPAGWLARAGLDAAAGLAVGVALLPVGRFLVAPALSRLSARGGKAGP